MEQAHRPKFLNFGRIRFPVGAASSGHRISVMKLKVKPMGYEVLQATEPRE